MCKCCEKCYYFILVTSLPLNIQKGFFKNTLHDMAQSSSIFTGVAVVCQPVARLSLNGSSYITVCLAIERLIGNVF